MAAFAALLPASIQYDVTTNTSTGVVDSNYDSITGLSQHIGTCFIGPPTQTGPCGTVSASTSALGATNSLVTSSTAVYDPQNGVYGSGNGSAFGDLSTGIVGAYVDGDACVPAAPACADGGTVMARLEDTLTFTNTTGHAVNLMVNWAFDGTITPTEPSYIYDITSEFCLAPGTPCPSTYYFQFQDSSGTITNTPPATGWVSTTVLPGMNADSETFQGVFSIPTGVSTDSMLAELYLHCVVAVCDFSHTGALTFGSLPSGVTFTSASGVLLTSSAPEPGSALLTLCGSVLVAVGTIRSRRKEGRSSGRRSGGAWRA
jgi:hypothetical protein